MIVVDTNVIAYLYLNGENTAAAEKLLQKDAEWIVPTLWRSEFRNILAGYIRRGQISFDQAHAIQSEAEDMLRDGEYIIDSRSVFELIMDSDCSAYDCEFVALARSQRVQLVTADKKILRSFPSETRALRIT